MAAPVKLSIVVPLYNTERYLQDLFDSFRTQVPGPYSAEFIFVDDESPDDSAHLAQQWLRDTGFSGSVVRQKNGGVSAARNAGLDRASGDWITFIDSDDYVSAEYFAAVANYLDEMGEPRREVSLVSCNVVRFDERTGERNYRHPLQTKFNRGNWVYDLNDYPELIQSQAASAFFNVERLRESGVRFLEGLHAAEDAIFVSSYLLTQNPPLIACVPEAMYLYRTRASGDSAVDQYKNNRGYYFERFSDGYLPVFEHAHATGVVPKWLGQYFVYDLRWFLPREQNVSVKATHFSGAEKQQILSNISDVLQYVDEDVIREYSITPLLIEQRNLMLALKGAPLTTDGFVAVAARDARRKLVCLRYFYRGEAPREEIFNGPNPARVVAAKHRLPSYLAQTVLRERILWVEVMEGLRVELNGVTQTITTSYPDPHRTVSERSLGFQEFTPPNEIPPAAQIDRPLARRVVGRLRREAVAAVPRAFEKSRAYLPGLDLRHTHRARLTQIKAQTPAVRQRYRSAWIFADRLVAGDDNAEALYWYVRNTRPDVNAWFALRKGTPHWKRMKAAGARLLDYGGSEHRVALLHADFVISSQLDVELAHPLPARYYWGGVKPWRYVYLQHGVLQHELSIWFNTRDISLLTTASVDEHQSIVEDDSAYVLTELETKLTGFARHDAIVRARDEQSQRRRTVLFAPTWRHNMLRAKTAEGRMRDLAVDISESEFGRNWFGFLNDPRLHALAREHDLDLAFLPHPNFRDKIPHGAISSEVEVMTSVDDMTALLVSSAVVVTDYSSITFDAAVAGASVGYFQFDHESFLNGAHTYVPGYWSYEKHGFGPISYDIDEAIEMMRRLLDPARADELAPYRDRIAQSMPNLDGGARERILQAILDLN